ncbi:hypothetical protein AAG906_030631 [Vitis piasezkii]
MATESLVEYKKEDFSKPKPQSKGNHAKDGGDKGVKGYTATKEGPRKSPNGKDVCLKRKALNAMIEEKQNEGDAHIESMQLLNALKAKLMPKTL